MAKPNPNPAARLHAERALRQQGITRIAGVDEAGRGPIAGPVVAAAVVLPCAWIDHGLPAPLRDVNDSKQLTPLQRESLFQRLLAEPDIASAIAIVDAAAIDSLNILRATHRAMVEALQRLPNPPDHVLVDGLYVPSIPFPQTAIVQGDARSYSIAAASILAKVTRDRLMREFDATHPGYGFAQHKGYGTAEHLAALRRLGPCPIHRRSFAPLNAAQGELFALP